MAKLVIFLAIAAILLSSTIAAAEAASYKKPVNKFLRDNTSGGAKLSDLCFVNIGVESGKNSTLVLDNPDCKEVEPEPTPDNDTEPTPDPEPVPDNDTDPIPEPDPEPQPSGNVTVINFVGDVYGSNGDKVYAELKSNPFDLTVVLGDLWYGNWEKFYDTYGTLGNKVACVLGNHEYSDNTDHLALPYCGNDWFIKKNGILLVGANANEGLDDQLNSLKQRFNDEDFMNNIHTVILNTHQPCRNTDNSHHGVEADVREFCEAFEALLPDNVNKYFIAGHDHVMMEGQANGIKYFISGAGGREHYDCGDLDDVFSWCDDSHYGYLQLKIQDGKVTEQFIDFNGGVVN